MMSPSFDVTMEAFFAIKLGLVRDLDGGEGPHLGWKSSSNKVADIAKHTHGQEEQEIRSWEQKGKRQASTKQFL